jgi:hypothetical protein
VTKRGSNIYFGPGMYFQTGQVIFVPEWPKGEFVSILASFCVWTNHLFVRMLQTGIPLFRVKSEEFQSSLSAVRTMCHPVRTPDSPASSVRTTCLFRPDTSLYREASVPACSVRTFQQHVRMPISSRTVH